MFLNNRSVAANRSASSRVGSGAVLRQQQRIGVTAGKYDRPAAEFAGIADQELYERGPIVFQVVTRDFDRIARGAKRFVPAKQECVHFHAALRERSDRGKPVTI
jgi:hypothetical protein